MSFSVRTPYLIQNNNKQKLLFQHSQWHKVLKPWTTIYFITLTSLNSKQINFQKHGTQKGLLLGIVSLIDIILKAFIVFWHQNTCFMSLKITFSHPIKIGGMFVLRLLKKHTLFRYSIVSQIKTSLFLNFV